MVMMRATSVCVLLCLLVLAASLGTEVQANQDKQDEDLCLSLSASSVSLCRLQSFSLAVCLTTDPSLLCCATVAGLVAAECDSSDFSGNTFEQVICGYSPDPWEYLESYCLDTVGAGDGVCDLVSEVVHDACLGADGCPLPSGSCCDTLLAFNVTDRVCDVPDTDCHDSSLNYHDVIVACEADTPINLPSPRPSTLPSPSIGADSDQPSPMPSPSTIPDDDDDNVSNSSSTNSSGGDDGDGNDVVPSGDGSGSGGGGGSVVVGQALVRTCEFSWDEVGCRGLPQSSTYCTDHASFLTCDEYNLQRSEQTSLSVIFPSTCLADRCCDMSAGSILWTCEDESSAGSGLSVLATIAMTVVAAFLAAW